MVFITKNGEDVIMDILNITDAKILIGTNKVVFITACVRTLLNASYSTVLNNLVIVFYYFYP